VVVGVAFGLAGSGLLSGLRPVGNAPATSLEWTTRPFVPGAHVVALTAIGDRVIATGSLNDEAAAWYSDDGGETWRPSTVDSTAARTGAALAGMPHEIGALAPIGDRLVGLDAYWFSSAQPRPGGGATHTGVWISDDQGSTWGWSPGIDGQAEQIAQSPSGLIAIGTADVAGNGEGRLAAAWSSVDGKSWKGLSLAGIDAGSAWTSVAFDGSRLMAVGSAPAPASSSGVPLSGVTPAAWLSTDGSTWTYIPLDPSLVGEAAAVVTSSNGFNVAEARIHEAILARNNRGSGGRPTAAPCSSNRWKTILQRSPKSLGRSQSMIWEHLSPSAQTFPPVPLKIDCGSFPRTSLIMHASRGSVAKSLQLRPCRIASSYCPSAAQTSTATHPR
jgi:hypothetical protein